MFSAAGFLGRPGIVMILPITTTTKPAPAESRSSRTVMVKPAGAASSDASSEKLYCVFAMHTGSVPKPFAASSASCFLAAAEKTTSAAP